MQHPWAASRNWAGSELARLLVGPALGDGGPRLLTLGGGGTGERHMYRTAASVASAEVSKGNTLRKPWGGGLNAWGGEHRLFRVEELWSGQPWRGRGNKRPGQGCVAKDGAPPP